MRWIDDFRAARRRRVAAVGRKLRMRLKRHQKRQSLVPTTPTFDADLFPITREFEANWRAIRRELDAVLETRDRLPLFHEISPDNYKISSEKWQTFIFYGLGKKSERNCATCPETARLLERVPRLENAWFSILAPGAKIPSHKGISKGLIRVHLGLVVPEKRDRCMIRVAGQYHAWEEGRIFVFDDTQGHQVWNDTDQDRVVLLYDFERPMRWRGRLITRLFLRAMRATGYFHAGNRNQIDWEARYYEGLSS